MTLDEIKRRISDTIDAEKEEIFKIGDEILKNPETGYREVKTSEIVRRVFDGLDIKYDTCALTGVRARLSGKESGANVCIIGELDAVVCQGSPIAGENGAAHACGHNAQTAALCGAAIALAKSGVMEYLGGDVTFLAAPAEEFIETDFRRGLASEGKIKYFGGKQQLIAEGVFDDVDTAMMIHAQPNEPEAKVFVRGHNLGFLAKTITFYGKAVHGSTPFDGVNALNAAALAILGVHANRETFREEDRIRIHPIITKGGDVVNSVPDEVCIETYVRGASLEAIKKGNAAVERATRGSAEIIGAKVEIKDTPGYLPLKESRELSEIFENNAKAIISSDALVFGEEITGSTDIGDLSNLIPVIQPSIGGFDGALHSRDFHIVNRDTAYILSAKILAETAAELLYNHAEAAKRVKASFAPRMSRDEYINYLEGKV